MKRKRQPREAQRAQKRVKLDNPSCSRPSNALLKTYYPEVVTLRQYLASHLPKKRRRKLQQYGQGSDLGHDPALSHLLDATLVGAFNHVPVEDTSIVEEDLTLFTQQLSTTQNRKSSSPARLEQHEIVDFAVWVLFRRLPGIQRPQHLLCQNYQRYLSANHHGSGLEIVPGIPGIYSNGCHQNVDTLKAHPWTRLPDVIGRGAERILGDMLVDCGLFAPINDSSNLVQLSGVPMSDLKVLPISDPVRDSDKHENNEQNVDDAVARNPKMRPLSDVRFVRHRMLYARPAPNATGGTRFGLNQIHVLNRCRNIGDKAETQHVMKYIFPAQFGLHNVLFSMVNRKETAHAFEDYTLRETEISRVNRLKAPRPGSEDAACKLPSLPRRLRGPAEVLVERLRKRHTNCAYSAMLNYYCPPQAFEEQDRDRVLQRATDPHQVSSFCRAAVSKVFPNEFWGSGKPQIHNRRVLHRNIDHFVRLRRFESISLHDTLQEMKLSEISWLIPLKVDGDLKASKSDMQKRTELMAEVLYYIFDSFLMPLIRGHFYVTESNVQRNQLFYFRHDIWRNLSEPSMQALKQTMLEECSTAAVQKALARRILGISHIRLLPKATGMRPIINLRRRIQKMRHGQLVLGKSINSILAPAFSVLNHQRKMQPGLLGSALFSVDDIFPRLQSYRRMLASKGLLGRPFYFAKVDVQACFDTIPQKRLMTLLNKLIHSNQYQISKYSRAKLLGGHSRETPGFGTKPSWKFLTKATSTEEAFDFRREVEAEVANGRRRTIFISGLAPKSESRGTLLSLLEEHIEANIIKLGKKFYRQRQGIAQGSIVSSLLCSYLYAEMEREVLGFVHNGSSVMLRLVDDFLVISTDPQIAERFLRIMHQGLPEYGVEAKLEKSRVNFDIEIDGERVSKTTAAEFPYCGTTIHTSTLDLSKDKERRKETNIADSVAVEYSKLPGQTFYRKTLNALKLQMRVMLLSTAYNQLDTVLSNLFHNFTEVAQKCHHYMRSLPSAKQPSGTLIIRVIDDMIKLSCVLMRHRKRTSKGEMPYECSVSHFQTRWLACKAFQAVFQRRQTKHMELLAWLQKQLGMPALRKQERRLSAIAGRLS